MNGKDKALLDSNTIIYASQGSINAKTVLDIYRSCYASIITIIEVYAFDFTSNLEKQTIDKIISGLEVINLDRNIAEQAIIYRKNKVKKLKLPDAVILATARYLDADLISNDLKDFENVDPLVNIIDLKDFKI